MPNSSSPDFSRASDLKQSETGFWRQQYYLLLAAVVFFTRIPVSTQLPDWSLQLNRTARFLPVVGLGLGILSAFSFMLFFALWHSIWLALVLSTVVSVLLTGAFHEDGFADSCDGFGGGWQKEQVLRIMKDSRLGTYGAVGLGLLLTVKLSALNLLTAEQIPWLLVLGHTLSRSVSASFMFSMDYVRDEVDRKFSGHSDKMSLKEVSVVWAVGIVCSLLILSLAVIPGSLFLTLLILLVCLGLLKQLLAWYWRKRIGGYTGDCLGGAQQLAEVVIYLALSAYWLNV